MSEPKLTGSEITRLDELAMLGWPSLETQDVDGWALRAANGTTQRTNSVWSHGSRNGESIEAKIDAVEQFYGERGLPAKFYVSPASKPSGLDDLLDDRGYVIDSERTLVLTGALSGMAELAGPSQETSVELVEELDNGWLEAHFRCARRSGDDARNRAATFGRIEATAAYASAIIGSEVISVVNGVLEDGWLGIYNVVTDPQFRRRGASRALLGLLADWAARQGASDVHLSVEENNLGAIAMYQSLGMSRAYRYHYRGKELD